MKNFVVFCILALSTVLVLTGCGDKNSQPQPTPMVTPLPGDVQVFDMKVNGEDVRNAVKATAEDAGAKYEIIDEETDEETNERLNYSSVTPSGAESAVGVFTVENTKSGKMKMITLAGSVTAEEFYPYVSSVLAQFDEEDLAGDEIDILKILPDDEVKTRTVETYASTIYCEYQDGYYYLRAIGKE